MLGNTQHHVTPDHSQVAEVGRTRAGVRRRTLQGVAVGAVSLALALGGQSVAQAHDHRDGRGAGQWHGQWHSWSDHGVRAAAAAPAPALAPVVGDLSVGPTPTSTAYSAWAPHVRPVVADVTQAFGVSTVHTRPGHSPTQELAIDFMVYDDRATGDAIAQYVLDNAAHFNVEYVIWQQRIHVVGGSGWQAMEDRGSPTANHVDHVHVSFTP